MKTKSDLSVSVVVRDATKGQYGEPSVLLLYGNPGDESPMFSASGWMTVRELQEALGVAMAEWRAIARR